MIVIGSAPGAAGMAVVPSACNDGLDNDGDARIDFDPATAADPAFQAGSGDPGCRTAASIKENPQC